MLLLGAALGASDPEAAYAAAVRDAATAEQGEISRDLIALTPDAPGLSWHDGRVLVVTWTGWDGYDALVGQQTALGREVWVTAAPELRDFCARIPAKRLVGRLEQALGLPPGNGKTRVVALWAWPEDLFRPCPDPEINDHECTLSAPVPADRIAVSAEHAAWMAELQARSYGAGGYPWTRLGYTYDWGNAKSETGLSEFVIRAGAGVVVEAVTPTQAYCQRD